MTPKNPLRPSLMSGALLLGVAGALGFGLLAAPKDTEAAAQTQAVTAPPPQGRQVATFAAGCFWSMEAIFKQLKGVDKVEPGYSGGTKAHPSYEQVENGDTGYAESINITFDPKVISYKDLLQVLLEARNPTTMNQQGPDAGPQYRSVVFYRNAAQKQAADEEIQEVNAQHVWRNLIVTEVQPFGSFWRAEGYHLDYYNLHPDQGYCANVIAPEIADFRSKFRSKLK